MAVRTLREGTPAPSFPHPPALMRSSGSARLLLTACACAGVLLAGCDTSAPDGTAPAASSDVIPGRFIVVLNAEAFGKTGAAAAERLIADADARDVLRYDGAAVLGFAADVDAAGLARLRRDPAVKYAEPDRVFTLARPGGGTAPTEATPWGVTYVGGARDGSGLSKKAWVIDTGIDLNHDDLNVDVASSVNFVARESSADDPNGHGTHVAGTIGAKDNGIGVVGVAPGVAVVAVRVLDRRGSGTYSAIIAGVNHVASKAKAGDVANMSLGGGVSQALNDAVTAAAGKGILFALAAGNESTDAGTTSPASAEHPNVYTVSAVGKDGCLASFSNYGAVVDVAAPGVSIPSTYKDNGYATLSGTSMASPHVAGLLLFGLRTSGSACGDRDGDPDPLAHN